MSARTDPNPEMTQGEASYFAMCILLPEAMLKQEIAKFGSFDLTNERHCRTLAKKFGVSEALIGYRIAMLQYEGRL